MGKGSTTTKTNQTQTQQGTSTTSLPSWVTNQAQQNLQFANQAAQNYQTPMQQTPAGFTPDQVTAFNLINQAAQQNPATAADQSALALTQQAGNYAPSTITAGGYTPTSVGGTSYGAQNAAPAVGYNAQGYNAQGYNPVTGQAAQINPNSISSISGPNTAANLSNYLQAFSQPYSSDVVNTSLQQMNLARQMAEQQTAAQAAQAGAFGSSREGVADAQTNQNFALDAQNMIANLNLQGFNTGLSALQSDESLGQQAALANQAVQQNTAQQNAQLAQNMGLANLGAQNTAAQYGAEAQNTAAQYGAGAQNTAAQYLAGAQNTVGLANQQAANTAAQFGASQAQQAALANQQAQAAASQFGLGQGFQAQLANQAAGLSQAQNQMASANQYANIGANQLANQLTAANAANTTGTQQQQYGQNVLNTAYQNALAQAQNPLLQLAIMQQGLSSTPYGTTTTSQGTSTGQGTTTQTQNPGLYQDIGTGLELASFSDMRLKTNVAPPMRDPLKAVRRMQPASFNWKPGVGPPGPQLGLIAQNVEQAAPEAVRTDPATGMKMINHPAMLGLLTGAINQIDRKVSARKKGVIPSAAPGTI